MRWPDVRAEWALNLMDTPPDIIGQSTLYMKIYFFGMPFFMLYNYGAAVLRAVGTRILWIYGFFPYHRSLHFLFICYPGSWIATIAMQAV